MPLKEAKYKYDQTILKVLGTGNNKKIKLVCMRVLRTAGVEDDSDKERPRGVNDEKLEQSISRTKRLIFEYAFCNPWDWFFTGTLDATKYDRTDLKKFHKDLTQWIRDYNKKHGTHIKFLFVPELHQDGKSWHIHGFLYGLPVEHLNQFFIGDKMGKTLADKVKKGDIVYNWPAYAKKFGFCDLEAIKNVEAASKYITKYINKSLETSVTELNARKYYNSRGLKVAEEIKRGTMSANIVPDWENEYCWVKSYDYTDELLEQLEQSIF